jgi:hypothetical protein
MTVLADVIALKLASHITQIMGISGRVGKKQLGCTVSKVMI